MSTTQNNPRGRMPLRTFDDLERREHEAIAAERDAAAALGMLLRELAVRLPEESTLIRDFADMARTMEGCAKPSTFGGPAALIDLALDNFTWRLVRHFEEAGMEVES